MTQVIIFNDQTTDILGFRRTLGPYRLAQSLKDSGYSVQVIDWFSSWSMPDLLNVLDKLLGPDTLWVGWSSTFMVSNRRPESPRAQMWSRPLAEIDQLFDYIQTKSPARLVYGGAFSHLMANDPRITTYVTGYADNSIIAYTEALARGELPPKFVDSRSYPEPDVYYIDTDWSDPSICLMPNEAVPIELARGCIFKCKFCNYPLIGKRKGTYQRPVEQIKKQMIQAWKATGCNRFYFTDDTFNDDQDRLRELHFMFQTLPFKPEFSCFLRLDLIERYPHTADLLLEMGLRGCFFGVETFNKKSAQCVGKGLDPEKTKAELVRLRKLWGEQVLFSVGLILGLPYDSTDYFRELEEWATHPLMPAHNLSVNTLWLGPPPPEGASQSDGWSQFSINTDAYGYQRQGLSWTLPSQGLTQAICERWREKLIRFTHKRFRVSEFYVQDYQNLGIPWDDLVRLDIDTIHTKWPVRDLVEGRKKEYQNSLMLFLGVL
jgi:hypothetical protein